MRVSLKKMEEIDEEFWVQRGAPRPVCARSHGRLRRFMRAAAPSGRTAARVGVSVLLASVLRLAAALGGGVAALSDSGDFHDIFYLRT